MDCRSFRESIFLFTDNELEHELVTSFREHSDRCPDCARRADYTRRLLTLVRERCCRQSAPPQLRIRILAVVRRRAAPEPWES
jgi:mycothiol system anti-sigma-R factor